MINVVATLAPSFLIGSSSFLQATSKPIISQMVQNSAGSDQGLMSYLPLSVWKKSLYTYNGRNVVTTLVLSILNGSSSFLYTIRSTIKAWMRLNFVKIPSPILELSPFGHLKN